MKYVNAAQAARMLGIGDKTIRRWLKEGKKLPGAIVKANGEYAIPVNEIEELKALRSKYAPSQDVTSHDQTDVSHLAEKLASLEQEVAELKKGQALPSEKGKKPSIPSVPIDRIPKTEVSQNRNVAQSGAMRLVDFSESSGIPLRTLHNWSKAGKIETTHDNRPGGGGIEYFISTEQQEKARMINSLRTPRKSSKFPPEGCITVTELAHQYSVAYGDIQFQISIGLGPGTTEDKEQLVVTRDPKGDYLTNEQQTGALQYWRKHGINFKMPLSDSRSAEQN